MDLIPGVSHEDPLDPNGMVRGQEPNDGNTCERGTVMGLQPCAPGDHVVATYKARLDGTGATLARSWMAPSHDPDLDSWWFVL